MIKATHAGWRKNLRKLMNLEAVATKPARKEWRKKNTYTGSTLTVEGDDAVVQYPC
jgi:hypothetical protein